MARSLPFTQEPLNSLMRAGCIGVYAAGVAAVTGWLPVSYASGAEAFAAFVLACHTLQLLLLGRHLRLYRGSAAAAVLLAILFGSLHWFPLLQELRQTGPGQRD